MAVPTTSWDETSPAGSQAISLGDDRIRELKTQIREVIDVDHDFPSSGQANDVGQHKKVTLQEQADLGTGAVSATILGSQTVSGKGELVYTDEDDNDIQITNAGKIRAESLGGVYPAANVAALATMMNLIYPVGHIYISYVSTNPGTLLGIGTWIAFAAGKMLIGLDAGGDTDFDVVGDTGGAKTATLAASNIPPLPVTIDSCNNNSGAGDGEGAVEGQSANVNSTISGRASTYANLGVTAAAFSVMNPFITVYMWRRTA